MGAAFLFLLHRRRRAGHHSYSCVKSTVFVQRKWQMCDRHRCSQPRSSHRKRTVITTKPSMDEEEESKGQPPPPPLPPLPGHAIQRPSESDRPFVSSPRSKSPLARPPARARGNCSYERGDERDCTRCLSPHVITSKNHTRVVSHFAHTLCLL